MVSAKKDSGGFTIKDMAIIAAVVLAGLIFVWLMNAVSANGGVVHPTPPVIFRTDGDINPAQMQRMVDWITANFQELYRLSKYQTITIAEGDSVTIKLKSNDNGILILKR